MPVLENTKHEKFAQGLAQSMTATAAMKAAGYKSDRRNASRLTTNDDIRARIAELQTQIAAVVIEKTGIDKTWVIETLRENVERCMQAVQPRPGEHYKWNPAGANRALHLIGKHLGMFSERAEVHGPDDFDHLSDAELADDMVRTAEALGIDTTGAVELANMLREASVKGKPN